MQIQNLVCLLLFDLQFCGRTSLKGLRAGVANDKYGFSMFSGLIVLKFLGALNCVKE